jgi:hypothetical protein
MTTMFDRFGEESREFTGGPASLTDRATRWLTPRGSAVTDGLRLAAVNTAGLIAGLAIVALVSIITRLFSRVVDLPVLLTGFVTVVFLVSAGAWIWYRYSIAYGRAARSRGREARADVFGAIAAAPFAVLALLLLSFGFIGMFFAVITFSASRAGDAFRQLGFAVLFFAIATATIVITRAASD